MARKGMMKGRGRGYKNVMGKDPYVHSQSAKGIKQPQKINELKIRIKALSKFKAPAFQEERELLKEEYKNLLNTKEEAYNKAKEYMKNNSQTKEILESNVDLEEYFLGKDPRKTEYYKKFKGKKGYITAYQTVYGKTHSLFLTPKEFERARRRNR